MESNTKSCKRIICQTSLFPIKKLAKLETLSIKCEEKLVFLGFFKDISVISGRLSGVYKSFNNQSFFLYGIVQSLILLTTETFGCLFVYFTIPHRSRRKMIPHSIFS